MGAAAAAMNQIAELAFEAASGGLTRMTGTSEPSKLSHRKFFTMCICGNKAGSVDGRREVLVQQVKLKEDDTSGRRRGTTKLFPTELTG